MANAIQGSVTSALDTNFRKSKIKYEKLDLSSIGEPEKLAFLLRYVFTHAECAALINLSEDYGYEPAMVNLSDGVGVLVPGYRDGHRVMIDDKEFVKILFERISNFLPKKFGIWGDNEWELLEINERLRFLRYGTNDQFKPHRDGSYTRQLDHSQTFITLQIYLNEGFEGGATTFLESISRKGNRVPVQPEPGMILVFQHDILHEGSIVNSGTKYTIRTDVLYKKPSDGKEKKNSWFLKSLSNKLNK